MVTLAPPKGKTLPVNALNMPTGDMTAIGTKSRDESPTDALD
jgi:hypothetical protein